MNYFIDGLLTHADYNTVTTSCLLLFSLTVNFSHGTAETSFFCVSHSQYTGNPEMDMEDDTTVFATLKSFNSFISRPDPPPKRPPDQPSGGANLQIQYKRSMEVTTQPCRPRRSFISLMCKHGTLRQMPINGVLSVSC